MIRYLSMREEPEVAACDLPLDKRPDLKTTHKYSYGGTFGWSKSKLEAVLLESGKERSYHQKAL